MITREQVADLQPGDVVELTSANWPDAAVRGRLRHSDVYQSLVLNSPCREETYVIRNGQGDPSCADERSLTVVSRAPRPLYVNHPRTEPVPGDVVRDADDESDKTVWMLDVGVSDDGVWCPPTGVESFSRAELPVRLRLLIDGETGQVVA